MEKCENCGAEIAEVLAQRNQKEIGAAVCFRCAVVFKKTGSFPSKDSKPQAGGELPPWYYLDEKGNIKFVPLPLAEDLSKLPHFFVGDNFFPWIPYQYDKKTNTHNGGVFRKESLMSASLIIQQYLTVTTTVTDRNIREVLNRWKERSSRWPERNEIDFNKNLINLKNGMYDIEKDIIIPHDPKYYSTVQMGFAYNLKTKSEYFEKWLEEMQWPENYDCLYEQLGYACTMRADLKKLFVHYSRSKGNSGKGTFFRVLEKLVSPENVSAVGWPDLDKRFSMAQLYRKQVNIDGDVPPKPISADMSKKLTGQDSVFIDEKNKPGFTARLYVKLFYSCNELPHQTDSTDANFFRILITPWDKRFLSDTEIDNSIEAKLFQDIDYIGTKALHEGLQRLLRNKKFSESARQANQNEEYRKQNDSLLFFIEDECLLGDGYCVKKSDFYEAYARSTRYAQGRQRVYEKLEEIGYKWKDFSRGSVVGRYYVGITLSKCPQVMPGDRRTNPTWLQDVYASRSNCDDDDESELPLPQLQQSWSKK